MTTILGVSNTWDAGAAIIVDGHITAAANEERFSRIKLERTFPSLAIASVLQIAGANIDEIDVVASGCWNGIDQTSTLPRLVDDIIAQLDSPDANTQQILQNRVRVSGLQDRNYRDELLCGLSGLGIDSDNISFYDHHFTHAVSAFCPSPFRDALVLVADGRGDYRSVSLWTATRDGLSLVDMASELSSPGALYGFVTKYLGFVPDRHEGKVTGLAAYGKMSNAYDLLAAGYGFDDASCRLVSHIGNCYSPFASASLEYLSSRLDDYSREDVAFAVQSLLEDSLISFLLHNVESLGLGSFDLCLAGGCMANVKLNFELRKLPQVRNVYVFPHMGDGGLPLGAAMAATMERSGESAIPMSTAYLGPAYSDKYIEGRLNNARLPYTRLAGDKIPEMTARLLSEGRIIGWFQGRMEVGPRALGARSILAPATDGGINESLNHRLDRTEFMPFAPATIDTYASSCFQDWHHDDISSQFMTMCYKCKPLLIKQCPAVVHVDNTARPQVVFRNNNPLYYDMIRSYIERTGIPAIINTSFNHHEEPIVNTPDDAIRSLINGNIDKLVIGSYLVDVC